VTEPASSSEYQITCTTKADRFNTHEYITHIGNAAGNWKLSSEDAIRRIDAESDAFLTVDRRKFTSAWSANKRRCPSFGLTLMENGMTTY
jgi:hypothetical protein